MPWIRAESRRDHRDRRTRGSMNTCWSCCNSAIRNLHGLRYAEPCWNIGRGLRTTIRTLHRSRRACWLRGVDLCIAALPNQPGLVAELVLTLTSSHHLSPRLQLAKDLVDQVLGTHARCRSSFGDGAATATARTADERHTGTSS